MSPFLAGIAIGACAWAIVEYVRARRLERMLVSMQRKVGEMNSLVVDISRVVLERVDNLDVLGEVHRLLKESRLRGERVL